MPPEKENHLPDFPEFPFPRERLTGPQRQVMSALAAGYTVCRASGPMIPDASCVLIGNGTRLARITVDSLEYRELIEVASTEDDPNRRWCQIIFYRLSRRGWYEVVRQKLAFAANEVEIVLPHRIAGIHAEIERYVSQYQAEPLVQVKGTRFEAYLEYRSDPSKRLLCEVSRALTRAFNARQLFSFSRIIRSSLLSDGMGTLPCHDDQPLHEPGVIAAPARKQNPMQPALVLNFLPAPFPVHIVFSRMLWTHGSQSLDLDWFNALVPGIERAQMSSVEVEEMMRFTVFIVDQGSILDTTDHAFQAVADLTPTGRALFTAPARIEIRMCFFSNAHTHG
jgi:hypothetical protein